MFDFSWQVKKLSDRVERNELMPPDVLIPSCAHPFVFPPSYKLSKIFNAKLIYEIRDIWPLSLIELANVPSLHPIVLWFKWIEKRAYRQADAVVSLLPNALDYMVSVGLDRRKFNYIPNGIDREEWEMSSEPLPDEHQALFQHIKKEGKLVVVYAGAHGPPNALDQILDLSKLNKEKNKPYHFILIGDGIEKEKLVKRVRDESIHFVSFLPRIEKKQVITALRMADVCFIGWKKRSIYKYGISPNKIGDYFMCEKPVLHALDAGNDPVQEADAGISVEPYNTEKIDDALHRFCMMSKEERGALGMNGRRYALENLDWKVLGRRYAEICQSK